MGRRTNNKEIRELIAKLRREIPDIALRTTLISGFPGETEEDHEILMQFVDDMEFDRLGVFAYSPEEDTPAFSFENQVPDEVKQDRLDEIMELQQEIAFEKSEAMKGRTLEVMIEGKVADENAYGDVLYGQPECGRTDLCKHRTFPDVRRFSEGARDRRIRIRSDWGGRG